MNHERLRNQVGNNFSWSAMAKRLRDSSPVLSRESQLPPSGNSNRFSLNPDRRMKSVILTMTPLTVITIAEIVPDVSDLVVTTVGESHNGLLMHGLGCGGPEARFKGRGAVLLLCKGTETRLYKACFRIPTNSQIE